MLQRTGRVALAPVLIRRQQGSALIVALVFLLAMTLIGVTAMQGTSQQESMAGNAREKNLAFQAAEAGLRRGERWMAEREDSIPPFPADAASCLFGTADRLIPTTDWGSFWMDYDWSGCQEYDENLGQVGNQPQFAIEDLGSISTSYSARAGQALNEVNMFRITSRATGGNANTVSILQIIYHVSL